MFQRAREIISYPKETHVGFKARQPSIPRIGGKRAVLMWLCDSPCDGGAPSISVGELVGYPAALFHDLLGALPIQDKERHSAKVACHIPCLGLTSLKLIWIQTIVC